jgi:predicted RNase H-like HicB family nuclease
VAKRFRVILECNELGGYTVTVPALPGCVTQGATREEALERAREAILCHVEGLAADGLPIPEGEPEEAVVEVSV